MPAEFSYFTKREDYKTKTILYESPDKNYIIYKKVINLYNSDDVENAKIIGVSTNMYTETTDADDIVTSTKTYRKFYENAGVPYGDNNILVTNNTRYNKYTDYILKDGIYTNIVNQNESTGEYANQIGYLNYPKDSSKIFIGHEVYFPLPTVTYTNAFNSLPQPNTAPLPS